MLNSVASMIRIFQPCSQFMLLCVVPSGERCKRQRFSNRPVAMYVNIHGVVYTLCASNLGKIHLPRRSSGVLICCNVSVNDLGRLHSSPDAVFGFSRTTFILVWPTSWISAVGGLIACV